jgi:GDP/UDP-N,N'-diacetylbacillosamine 2-epimerase (hydrolysing)
MKKNILVVTVGRLDWNIWKPILEIIKKNQLINFKILATGMHFEKKYGSTYKEIIKNGYKISYKIKQKYVSSEPYFLSYQTSNYLEKISKIVNKHKFDYLMLVGDRFESLAAALSCIPSKIPIFHFHGGELSEGSIDETHRHLITKSSHIHFCTTDIYKKRIIQLGEEKWRIFTTGSPAVHKIETEKKFYNKKTFYKKFNLDLEKNFFILNFNIETMNYKKNSKQIRSILQTLCKRKENVLITKTNFDTGSDIVNKIILSYVKKYKNLQLSPYLGDYYFSAMKYASLMIGNSSSGIIEAASFGLPVINIGDRQKGRLKSKNTIDCNFGKKNINKSIKLALSLKFKNKIKRVVNVYFNKNFQKLNFYLNKIFRINSDKLIIKKFYDI